MADAACQVAGLTIWVVRTVFLLVSIQLRRRLRNCRERAPVDPMHDIDIVGDNHLMGKHRRGGGESSGDSLSPLSEGGGGGVTKRTAK
jgi:hypothetical protein